MNAEWVIKAVRLSKPGEVRCDDYYSYARYPGELRLAVADGASEAIYSGMWAKLMAKGFVRSRGFFPYEPEGIERFRSGIARLWQSRVDEKVKSGKAPWYVEQKVEEGAFATLAAVVVEEERPAPSSRLALSILTVGDASVFLLEGERVAVRQPALKANQFGTSPSLLPTSSRYRNQVLREALATTHEIDTVGDFVLVLCTDFMAAWIAEQIDSTDGLKKVRQLVQSSRRNLRREIREILSHSMRRKDDCTLVIVYKRYSAHMN